VSRASAEPPAQTLPDSIRSRHVQRIHALNLPARRRIPVTRLCEIVGEEYGRTILLVPMHLPVPNVDGMWLSTRSGKDYIAVESRLSPVHQLGVIVHELGHVLCDHQGAQTIDLEAAKMVWPALRPELVHRVLGRDHSDSEAERDAEYVGSLLSTHTTWSPDLTAHLPPAERAIAHRLTALLEHRS
jgi:hypothetical protein